LREIVNLKTCKKLAHVVLLCKTGHPVGNGEIVGIFRGTDNLGGYRFLVFALVFTNFLFASRKILSELRFEAHPLL
jgi:hypothetical protein